MTSSFFPLRDLPEEIQLRILSFCLPPWRLVASYQRRNQKLELSFLHRFTFPSSIAQALSQTDHKCLSQILSLRPPSFTGILSLAIENASSKYSTVFGTIESLQADQTGSDLDADHLLIGELDDTSPYDLRYHDYFRTPLCSNLLGRRIAIRELLGTYLARIHTLTCDLRVNLPITVRETAERVRDMAASLPELRTVVFHTDVPVTHHVAPGSRNEDLLDGIRDRYRNGEWHESAWIVDFFGLDALADPGGGEGGDIRDGTYTGIGRKVERMFQDSGVRVWFVMKLQARMGGYGVYEIVTHRAVIVEAGTKRLGIVAVRNLGRRTNEWHFKTGVEAREGLNRRERDALRTTCETVFSEVEEKERGMKRKETDVYQ